MVKENVKLDRMRYVKDQTPSLMAILAIVFDVLYFVLIYKINNDYFYTFMIGASIVVNLLFMLFGFWCSIEVKNYHGNFGYVMIILGVLQIFRIFVYPMNAHNAKYLSGELMLPVMSDGQFMQSIIYLGVSAALMIVGGLMSIKNSGTLKKYLDSIENK